MCLILTYMSRLTDFGVCHCLWSKMFSFDTYLWDQRVNTWSDSIYLQVQQLQCIHAASHILDLYPWSNDFALYFQYCLMDEHHTRYSESVWHCEWPHTVYMSLWPTFHSPGIWTYLEHHLVDSHHTMDNSSVWHCKWPHTIYRLLWPIFHGSQILLYISNTVYCLTSYLA